MQEQSVGQTDASRVQQAPVNATLVHVFGIFS